MIEKIKKYGIDAPYLVMILGSLGISNLMISGVWLHFLRLDKEPRQLFWVLFIYFILTGLSFLVTAFWMLYNSVKRKPKILANILEELRLRGDESLLDLGCGRGMFLMEAAKLLPEGKALGIDIWKIKDQSGNSLAAALKNISQGNLNTNIEIHTEDLCSLPYPDQSQDVVLSSLALHNIKEPDKQKKAVNELLRVLKPNGKFAIFDILSVSKYKVHLQDQCILSRNERVLYCPMGTILIGRKKG